MRLKTLCVVLLSVLVTSCNIRHAKNIKDCEFSLNSVSNVSVNNVALDSKNILKNLPLLTQIMSAGMTSEIPISFLAELKIDNPNDEKAELSALEWILLIRDIEVATGVVDQKVKIDAKQTTFVTIPVETNTGALAKLSPQEIKTIVTNLSNSRGLPRNSVLKVKPAMKIGKKMLKTPNYFTIDVSGK
ncbi:MAG: LEA type 2 family protein [Bacteroidales bacterium]|nr:LEA type 2 family protein [Bacteroidales bacterium]